MLSWQISTKDALNTLSTKIYDDPHEEQMNLKKREKTDHDKAPPLMKYSSQ